MSRAPIKDSCLAHDEITDAQAPAGDVGRPQTAPTPQRLLGGLPGHPIQVSARLARPFPAQLDPTDAKGASDPDFAQPRPLGDAILAPITGLD